MDWHIFKELHILIVDDDPFTRELIVSMLKHIPNMTIHQASDGEEALELLSVREYDMLLLDLYMPKMNGEALLAKIKNSKKIECTSLIVLMTTDRLNKREIEEIGAKVCLTKPFDFSVFEETIYDLLSKGVV